MKFFFALCCFLTTAMLSPGLAAGEWYTDFSKAKAEALKARRPIYVLFTNSDAAPALALDRTIFNQKKFQDYADRKLVLMKVDFPAAIHLQSKGLQQQNRELREQFKISILPTALLLDANGNLFIDFVKADGSVEKHRRKMNEIMDFNAPKRYSEYLDGFVKKYIPPEPSVAIAEEKTAVKTDKKPAKKPARKPAKKQQNDNAAETNIPDENAGKLLVPLDPEGNFQDWLKSSLGEEAVEKEKEKEAEEAKEIIEEAMEALEEAEKAEDNAPQDAAAPASAPAAP